MEFKTTGSAVNIQKLIIKARAKISRNKETNGVQNEFYRLIKKLNEPLYKQDTDYDLNAATLQRHIFYAVNKAVKEGDGKLGFTFFTPYLDRLSKFVYNKSFEKQFKKFTGQRYGIFEGVEKVQIDKKQEINIEFIQGLDQLGIIGITNKLTNSRFEPIQCMNETKHNLSFMGILGTKWVKEIDDFVNFLKYIKSRTGKVRYLLIDPNSKSFRDLKTMRGIHLKDESTQIFKELISDFDCLEVKFYDFIPAFRLVFIDNKLLAVSRYKLDERHYMVSQRGWEAPHLVIDGNKGDWSLYEPFSQYYESVWKKAQSFSKTIK